MGRSGRKRKAKEEERKKTNVEGQLWSEEALRTRRQIFQAIGS